MDAKRQRHPCRHAHTDARLRTVARKRYPSYARVEAALHGTVAHSLRRLCFRHCPLRRPIRRRFRRSCRCRRCFSSRRNTVATCPQVYLSHCTSAAQPAVLAELGGEVSIAALGCRQGHEQDHQKDFHRDVPDAISRMFQRCVPNPCGAMGLGRLARAGGRALGLTAGRAVRAVSIVARALQRRGRAVHACFACTGLNQPWPRTRDHADRVLAPSGT